MVSSGATEHATAGGPTRSNGEQPKACLGSRHLWARSTGWAPTAKHPAGHDAATAGQEEDEACPPGSELARPSGAWATPQPSVAVASPSANAYRFIGPPDAV